MRFKKIIIRSIYLTSFLLLIGASVRTKSDSPSLHFESSTSLLKDGLYTNKEKKYSIQFPLWWSVEEVNQGDQIKASRLTEGPHDLFQEKASLSVLQSESPIFVDSFFKENLRGLKQLFRFQEIKRGETEIHQNKAKWIVYSFQPDSLNKHVQILQYFLTKEKQTCILTFISTPTQFNQYKNQFLQIAQSFKLQ